MMGVKASPIVTIRVVTEVPRLAITAIRKMIPGMARNASMKRLTISSNQPRKYPSMRPIAVPATVASSVAAGAISIVLREPASTRESTSRPMLSVPKG